mmetsp:Transcript_116271/g.323871  ORF Transcript_116271/g.323871 Transcript_116271/m.323871 type:complete len:280 (+) Transcript_116271:219-1058(+)
MPLAAGTRAAGRWTWWRCWTRGMGAGCPALQCPRAARAAPRPRCPTGAWRSSVDTTRRASPRGCSPLATCTTPPRSAGSPPGSRACCGPAGATVAPPWAAESTWRAAAPCSRTRSPGRPSWRPSGAARRTTPPRTLGRRAPRCRSPGRGSVSWPSEGRGTSQPSAGATTSSGAQRRSQPWNFTTPLLGSGRCSTCASLSPVRLQLQSLWAIAISWWWAVRPRCPPPRCTVCCPALQRTRSARSPSRSPTCPRGGWGARRPSSPYPSRAAPIRRQTGPPR